MSALRQKLRLLLVTLSSIACLATNIAEHIWSAIAGSKRWEEYLRDFFSRRCLERHSHFVHVSEYSRSNAIPTFHKRRYCLRLSRRR